MSSAAAHRAAFIAGVGLVAWLGIRPLTPPAVPISPAADEFDVSRAMEHVRRMAREPHPAESAEDRRVQEYLVDQLKGLGLEPLVQTASVIRPRDGFTYEIHNLLARLPGSERNGTVAAVLLCAHYDSVPMGPGAADDAAAVAAILESIRALRAGPAPRRDVLVLLTDGEELGMLGARAFAGEGRASEIRWSPAPPPLPDRRIVLNFEARGTSGPSIMFETAAANLEIVRHYAAAAPRPIASSLSYDVYRLMPNDTDFTIFRRAGGIGLNFAIIGDPQDYHTARDNIQHLDPRSLAHHGRNALALARHFANLDDGAMARIFDRDQPDAVYFNLSAGLVVYPGTWVWPIGALQIAVTAWVIGLAAFRRALGLKRLVVGGLIIILSLLVVPLILMRVVEWIPAARRVGAIGWLMAAAVALAAIVVGTIVAVARRAGAMERNVITLALMAILGVVVNRFVPGASYLVAWPAIFAAGGFWLGLAPGISWPRTLGAVVAAAPTLLLIPPTVYLAFLALGRALLPLVAVPPALYLWLLAAAATVRLTADPKS